MEKKVVLGLSGGMDSAYAAITLQNQGFEVIGVYALMHDSCDGYEDACALADALSIKLLRVDARGVFEDEVIKPFVSDYLSGLTPNPCVRCNPLVKFKILLDKADELGVEKVATGHYSTPCFKKGRYSFSPADDSSKDQGYFLYGLSQESIKRLVMPLSGVLKSDIKQYFASNPVFAFTKGESNDICFAGDGYRTIISQYGDFPAEGEFVDSSGAVLGKHKGVHNYTVGQRKGLGIALGRPAFVKEIDCTSNRVVLAFADEALCCGFTVKGCNYLVVSTPKVGDRFNVKVRYRAHPAGCTVTGVDGETVSVAFDTPQKVTAPGQSAVFYDEDGVIAFGGIIAR